MKHIISIMMSILLFITAFLEHMLRLVTDFEAGLDLVPYSGGGCGVNVPAGTPIDIYVIPTAEIADGGYPSYIAAPSALGDQKTLDGDFTLVATSGLGYFRKLKILSDTGQITSSLQGPRGSQTFTNQLVFSLADFWAEQSEFAETLLGKCLLFLVPTRAHRGEGYAVLGHPEDPAYLSGLEMMTGLVAGDKNGGDYTIMDPTGTTPDFYTGVVNVTPNP